ncbi:MAG: NAD(P)/FAD-dependent oxidoreductase [Sphingobacteriaceae bacterium]|nr:NAD(P)/FAD-dependent oxidoreductase [Cytophagaceae bacterium]
MNPSTSFDVLLIGGSVAGLSAALVLGRSRRTVLVLDAGKPANRQTPHSHSFLTRDGTPPAQLAALAREQALAYPTVTLRSATVMHAVREHGQFLVKTSTGDEFRAKRLLLATGVADQLPDLPGFAECWGISVLHCPYCHGYEVGDQRLGVLANGDAAFEFARLLLNWSRDLTLFTNGPATLSQSQAETLTRLGVGLVETPLTAIPHELGYLSSLALADGRFHPLDALFARVPFAQTSDLGEQLGCEFDEWGLLKTDDWGKTSVEGVFAAGDNSTLMRQVVAAAANGAKAAAFINRELVEEEFPAT